MFLSTTKVYFIVAISAASLTACGGGSSASDDSGAQNPELNPVALDTIASISATENNSETIDISWTPSEDAELNISQAPSPELGLKLEGTSLTVTLPEVTTDTNTEFTVELIQDGEPVDSQTVSVNIDNDPRQLYAQNYDDYRLAEEVATETDSWRLENIGIYAETITQDGEPQTVCYPTPENCRESYAFYEGNADYVRGDFNDDGHTDVAVSIVYFPHTLPRDITEYPARVMIFENNGDGTMKLNNSIIADYENIHRFSAYRIKSADFTGDGVPDIIASSLYQVFDEWNEERAEHERGPELPLLLLSNGEGQLVDASNQLNLDMSGADDASAYSIGHNMSVGDINNDGHPDIFTGISVLLNDGNGVFTDKTDDYFTADEQWSQPFASALGDMNDDGRTDLAMFNYLQVFPEPINIYRSQLLISASGGSSLTMVNQPTIIPLPEEYWGADNTHTNYAIMGDLAEDYPGDELVIAQTRLDPYYDGRVLRMFALDEQENLIELTDRLENNDLRLGSEHHGYVSGEGSLHLMDFDKDGTLDIVDVTQGGSRCESEDKCQQELAVFLNQGDGTFVYNPIANIPSITEYSFEGYNFEDNDLPNLGTSYPVDLGHPSGFSLLSRVSTVGPNFLKNGDEEQMIWYIMNRKENGL
ncbi:FG-GAP-like repeat-containing protein [Marinobacter sp.]|uniref:FG-GAP repeat domain-containing protein n=1 Tax=Marinobacter sp. TaxID=50741 RepID=UPI0026341DCA|nr:FG-GAP-like repeat-containing protein [Marinobacter sp.]